MVNKGKIDRAGVREALRFQRLEQRIPDERDRRPSTFDGRRERALLGQTDIFGGEVVLEQLALDEDEVEQ